MVIFKVGSGSIWTGRCGFHTSPSTSNTMSSVFLLLSANPTTNGEVWARFCLFFLNNTIRLLKMEGREEERYGWEILQQRFCCHCEDLCIRSSNESQAWYCPHVEASTDIIMFAPLRKKVGKYVQPKKEKVYCLFKKRT